MSKYTAEQVIHAADLEQAKYDGDLIISRYLREYATLLRERESAKAAAVTREMVDAACNASSTQYGEGSSWDFASEKERNYARCRMRRALEAVAPMLASARVPDGWQLVPVEPTVEMVDSGLCGCMENDVTIFIYKNMLAAAPKPETEK